jgi:hypothetical protein
MGASATTVQNAATCGNAVDRDAIARAVSDLDVAVGPDRSLTREARALQATQSVNELLRLKGEEVRAC